MGLSVAISGGIILTVIMLVLLSMPGLVEKMFSIGDITTKVSQHEQKISNTEISMGHLSVLVGEPKINFTLSNFGSEKLWDFEKFDLFIKYEGAEKLTESLSYGGSCNGVSPISGEWCIEFITNDVLDPDILNAGERATIWTQVDENLATTQVAVSMTTNNGVVTTVSTTTCGSFCYQMIWNLTGDEGTLNWNNMGSGAGIPEEYDSNDNYRTIIDLTDMSQWRFVLSTEDNDGTPICEMGVQYSTAGSGGPWRGIDNGNVGFLSTVSNPCDVISRTVTPWTDLNATAQADVWLRIAGIDNGAGSTDVQFGTVQVQFRG